MKTRYFKRDDKLGAEWMHESDNLFVEDGGSGWAPSNFETPERLLASYGSYVIECTADGTPLGELPADRLTLAEFDAFAARVRANLALLEKEGER